MVSMIPKEYQRVEYLETVGHDTRINTGVSGNDTTLEIDCIFMPTKMGNSYTAVFGNYLDENDHYCWRCILQASTSSNYQTSFWVTMGAGTPGGNKSGTASARPVNNDDTILNKRIHLYESYGAYTISGTTSSSYSRAAQEAEINTTPIAIGAASIYSSGGGTNQFRIYSFWMKSQGQYVRNYIPCVRLSDSQAGFYDTINNTFNPSIGAKDFTPGPTLPEHSDVLQYRRNILLNSPHLTTVASGNTSDSEIIAHFKTDMVAPIKSLKVNFAPVQEGSGDPSSDNVRPIIGHNSLEVKKCGVNFLQCDTFTNITKDNVTFTGYRNADNEIERISVIGTRSVGNLFVNLNYKPSTYKWPPIDGKYATYAYSDYAKIMFGGQSNPVDQDGNSYQGSDASWRYYNNLKINFGSYALFRIQMIPYSANPVSMTYDTDIYPMVCLQQDAGCDFEPYRGQTITVTLPNTFYGGYLDLIKGELVETCKKITLSGQGGSWSWNCYTIGVDNINVADSNGGYNILACSHTNHKGYGSEPFYSSVDNVISISQGKSIRYRDNSKFTDLESAQAYIQAQANAGTPVQLVAKLATPIVYTIDPISLKTLRGINNIWSDAGSVEVQYWTH